jgi:hypothetical protein
MALAKGDVVRMTRGAKTDDERRVDNGNVFTVAGFDRKGRIMLNTGGVLSAEHGHLAYGYCLTSHTAQSKSVRDVLIAQSEDSFVASSAAQFYVSASRARETIRIYTDSRSGLQQAVGNAPSSRMAAVELAGFSRSEINAMSDALNRDRWREALQQRRQPAWQDNVKSRAGVDKTKSHVQQVIESRRGKQAKKGEVISWKAYVEMKRQLAGPDGKNRSKGQPAPAKQKGRAMGALPKRSEHTTPVRKQMEAAHERKKAAKEPSPANDNVKKSSRVERFKTAARGAGEHFKTVMSRLGKQTGQAREAVVQRLKKAAGRTPGEATAGKSPGDRAAEHRQRQKRQDIQKTPAPVKTPTPTVRKGR